MTGLPPNIQIAAQRRQFPTGDEAELIQLRRLLVAQRNAEKGLGVATSAEEATARLNAKKAADKELRKIANRLIQRGHP